MSKETVSVDELLKKEETDFDSYIKTMHAKALMDIISRLQKEMTKEQENFNSLSTELQNRKERSSRQSKQISKDMMLSQQRLTMLMNRSMKCFAQQSVNSSNQGTQLARRNSAKGSQPVVAPHQRITNVHRSRSLHAVNKLNEMTPSAPGMNDPSRSNNVVVVNSQRHNLPQHQPVIKSVVNGRVHNNIANIGGRTVIVKASSQGNLASGDEHTPEQSVSKISIGGGSNSVQNTPATVSNRDGKFSLSSSIPNSSSSTTAAAATTAAADDVGGGGGGGGMYTKRKQGQSNKVTTSSTVTFLPPRGPMSSSHTSLSSPSGSSVVVLKTSQPRPASIAYSHSPLQQALSRPGVSQSQIIGQGPVTSERSEDGRALPSVKLLAKSFGSSSALHHVTPASSTNPGNVSGKRTNVVVVSGKHGSRSVSSNVYSNDSKNLGSQSNPVSFTKGNMASAQSSITANGKTSPAPQKPADGVSELEKARARLKTNRNSVEIITETPVPGPSNGVSNDNESRLLDSSDSAAADEAKQKEQRIAENVRVGTYIKRSVPQALPSGSNSSSNSTAASSLRPTIVTISSAKSNPAPSQQPSINFSNTANQTLNGPRISSAALPEVKVAKMKHSKSKEELQSEAKNQRPVPDRALLLKQIESRRIDFDNDQSNAVFKSTAKLSASMPSLLVGDKTQGTGTKEDPIKSGITWEQPTGPVVQDEELESDTCDSQPRMNLTAWDPSKLISDLYEVKLMDEVVEDISHQFVSMEGLMEKLPMNKKKATLLKTWKRRFFKAQDGWMYYYESNNRDRPSETIQLMGGAIHDLGNRILGIDDGRGRYLMVRCPTEKEYGQWKVALESQTADNTKATYVQPFLTSPRNATKNVLIVDLGSSAIRAGILGERASLPQLFFPSVIAIDKSTGDVVGIGQDALRPETRQSCNIVLPIRPSNKVDQFNIEVNYMKAIFEKIFKDLKLKREEFWVMLSTPQNLGEPLKKGLMQCLVDTLNVHGVCMVQQSLLALYSYNATSGIIVDIGHRIEILPIFDGFVIEGGVARCPFGAQKVQESLTTSLLSNNYKMASRTEQWLVRYIMEKSCYVATVYAQEEEFCMDQPQTIRSTVDFHKYALPEGSYEKVSHDLSRFKSPEGFFNADLWEMDYPSLQKLIHQAIQTCPMDNRRHMWRAVFLSGGVTMLPGFAERLEGELTKLAPPGVPVEVHAAPQRYHAAYVGACSVALMPQFVSMAISREEWKKDGPKAFRKWKSPSA